jgi:hypothetical protein
LYLYAEVAFTGDTTADWIANASGCPVAADALRAKLLICECTFVDDKVTPEGAREYGHTHVDEIAAAADKFENEVGLTHTFKGTRFQPLNLSAISCYQICFFKVNLCRYDEAILLIHFSARYKAADVTAGTLYSCCFQLILLTPSSKAHGLATQPLQL